ncbi:YbaB/EbfC family nucleoid-associated protein [Saccharothrix sp. AJ9571]|nr:YbaB/EbfC family nucleoid-associated protein [Saccharothrix sp. AJ9571]
MVSSLSALAARTNRADEGLLALRKDLAQRTVTARDRGDLVEVEADAAGKVLAVSVNSTLMRRVDARTLANAILEATTGAQRAAADLVAQRRAYHLG